MPLTCEATMGRKKGPSRMSVVKIETEAVRKAKLIAQARGLHLSEYLSQVVAAAVAKDFPKVWKQMSRDEGFKEEK